MEPIHIFCHECDLLYAIPNDDSVRIPRCEICGSEFVEVLMDSAIPEPSPEASPRQGGSPRGAGSPMLEDHFVVGPAEHGFPFQLGNLLDEPAEMFGAADEALMFLNPMVPRPSRGREGQRNGSRGSLAPVMDQLTRMLQPSRAPTCPSTLHSLRRSNVSREDQDLLRECCVVCHEKYKENERVVTLPCDHVFHENCVMQWLDDHNTCPVCRFSLPARASQPPPNTHFRGSNPAAERAHSGSRRGVFGQIFGPTIFDNSPNQADQSTRGIASRTRSHRTPPQVSNQLPFFNPYNQRERERDQNPRRRAYHVQQDSRGPSFSRWDPVTGRHHHRQRQSDGVEDRSNRRQRRDRNLSDRRVLR